MRRLPHAPVIGDGFLLPARIARIDDDGAIWVATAGGEPERAHVAAAVAGDAFTVGGRVLLVLDPEEPPTIVSTVLERVGPPRTLRLEATESLVLRCGEAVLELHGDGSVRIHGGYVETEADGICRIVGAQVQVN